MAGWNGLTPSAQDPGTGNAYLYEDTGALKYRGTSGSAATIVNADGTLVGGASTNNIPVLTPPTGSWLNYGPGIMSSWATSTGFMKAAPIYVPANLTFDRIACRVTASGTAGALVRLGIYSSNAAGLPDALVLDAGQVSSASTGTKEITISQALTAGKYWLVAVGQSAGCTLRADSGMRQHYYQATYAADDMDSFEQSGVTGALPSTFTGTSMRNTAPRIMLRVA